VEVVVPPATSEVFDLQRLVPDLVDKTDPLEQRMLDLHLARYRFAARFCRGSRVLDAGCGVGYGTAMLRADGALEVLGLDVSDDAIRYASSRYARPGVRFLREDLSAFSPDRRCDAVVSLATIEHLDAPAAFVARVRSWIEPGGVFVASVPTTLASDLNPYQRHDFTEKSFSRLLSDARFSIVDFLRQANPVSPVNLLHNPRAYGVRSGLFAYYAAHPGKLLRRVASTLTQGFSSRHFVVAARAV
jgi:SAM-dependent methyltransferase